MQSFRFIEPILETQIVEQKFFANRISPSFLIREGKKKRLLFDSHGQFQSLRKKFLFKLTGKAAKFMVPGNFFFFKPFIYRVPFFHLMRFKDSLAISKISKIKKKRLKRFKRLFRRIKLRWWRKAWWRRTFRTRRRYRKWCKIKKKHRKRHLLLSRFKILRRRTIKRMIKKWRISRFIRRAKKLVRIQRRKCKRGIVKTRKITNWRLLNEKTGGTCSLRVNLHSLRLKPVDRSVRISSSSKVIKNVNFSLQSKYRKNVVRMYAYKPKNTKNSVLKGNIKNPRLIGLKSWVKFWLIGTHFGFPSSTKKSIFFFKVIKNNIRGGGVTFKSRKAAYYNFEENLKRKRSLRIRYAGRCSFLTFKMNKQRNPLNRPIYKKITLERVRGLVTRRYNQKFIAPTISRAGFKKRYASRIFQHSWECNGVKFYYL